MPGFEAAGDKLAIELEADVESNRTDGRTIAQAEPGGRPSLVELDLRHPVEDVAAVQEHGGAEIAPHRHSQLAVEQQQRIAAEREPGRADRIRRARGIESKPANGRVAAGEESLACGEVVDRGLRHAVDAGHRSRESVGEADRDTARKNDASLHRETMEPEALRVRLQESDLAAKRARRDTGLLSNEGAAAGIQDVVSRIAGDRPGKDRE